MGKTEQTGNMKNNEQQDGITALWPELLNAVKANINKLSFEHWFENIISVKQVSGVIYITVPDETACEYMEDQFSKLICDNLQRLTGENMQIAFVPAEGEGRQYHSGKTPAPARATAAEETPDNTDKADGKTAYTGFAFNSRYTFNSFVVGNSNRFAHAASMAVAEKPARTYNPLFIYGGSGLGKTHLMHAIGQTVLRKNPSMKVVYVSTESFTNDFISMVRTGKAYNFKNRYRSADIFLVDDIQFLTGKEGIQEEFFHTFNALVQAGKQIVMSSDRPPKEMETLDDRLRTRFEWGLIADIQPPDVDTRMAIVKQKAKKLNLDLPTSIVELIADRLKTNIRQLEGTVKKIYANLSLNNVQPTIETVNQFITEIQESKKPLSVQTEEIIEHVSNYYGVSASDVKSIKKNAAISQARKVSMYILNEISDMTLQAIGNSFGDRHHSTVIYSIDSVSKQMAQDVALKTTIYDIIKDIQDSPF